MVVSAEADLRPTEDLEKVKRALTNLFSGDIEVKGNVGDYGSVRLSGEGQASLERFKIIIQRDRIRAAARAQLFRGMTEQQLVVHLNKQVAYAGHVSFSAPEGESPLGPIRLTIKSDHPVGVIDWLTGGVSSARKERRVSQESL
jgi:uncharacterized protein